MRRITLLLIATVTLLFGAVLVRPGSAQSLQVLDVELGFGGSHKVGCWAPVWVSISGGSQGESGRLRLITRDGDDAEVAYEDDARVSVGAGETVRLLRNVKLGRVQAGLRIELWDDDRCLVSREFMAGEFSPPLLATRRLVVTLGIDELLDQASRRRMLGTEEVVLGKVSAADRLPDRWIGYEGVDTLVVSTARMAELEEIAEAQFAALEQWVRLGGRLLLSVGERGGEVFGDAPAAGRFARFAPGRFIDVTTLRSASALESYSGASQRLDLGRGREGGMATTVLGDVAGRIEIAEKGLRGPLPLAVRSPYGFGEVVFLAFDLDGPALSAWEGRPRLVARLLRGDRRSGESDEEQLDSRKVTHVGFQDLAGQLRSALDQFPGVMVVPFYWVAGLVFVYILLIGPGDYFFLQKVVGRMPWTWVTFPVVCLGFAGLALLLYYQLKEDRLRINQIDLVDVDFESALVRGSMWAHAYSPRTETYEIELRGSPLLEQLAADPPGMLLSWQGLPGTGLGGLNSTSRARPFAAEYRASHAARLSEVPIQIASTKAFIGRWWGRAELQGSARLEADLDGLLRGEVVNPLPFELTDCLVLFSNWVYRLEAVHGSLGPGQSTRIDLERPLNLEWRLTRRRVVETRDLSTPWSENIMDVDRVLEIMMFHQAAGGDAYTRLTHRYQPFVDLSHQLKGGRAILFGRCPATATELAFDQQTASDRYDDRWSYCRVVFPVENWRRDQPRTAANDVP